MKILFNCHEPFCLAHGGVQVQIEQTKAALDKAGVAVEPLRWWDDRQRGEVLHHFGRLPTHILRAAQQKGMKVVMTDLFTEQGSRSAMRLTLQAWVSRGMRRTLPASLRRRFEWESYRLADACLALTPWEAHLMTYLYEAPRERVHVVSNGVEEIFLESEPASRGTWLVCTATLTERKRVLEMAPSRPAPPTRTPASTSVRWGTNWPPFGMRTCAFSPAASSVCCPRALRSRRAPFPISSTPAAGTRAPERPGAMGCGSSANSNTPTTTRWSATSGRTWAMPA